MEVKEKLIVTGLDGSVVATGDAGTNKVTISGLKPDTVYPAGTYKVAFQNAEGVVGEAVGLNEFKTLAKTTSTTTTTKATTTSTTSTTKATTTSTTSTTKNAE